MEKRRLAPCLDLYRNTTSHDRSVTAAATLGPSADVRDLRKPFGLEPLAGHGDKDSSFSQAHEAAQTVALGCIRAGLRDANQGRYLRQIRVTQFPD